MFSTFNQFPSLYYRKFSTKLDHYFWSSVDAKTPFSFLKDTEIASVIACVPSRFLCGVFLRLGSLIERVVRFLAARN